MPGVVKADKMVAFKRILDGARIFSEWKDANHVQAEEMNWALSGTDIMG